MKHLSLLAPIFAAAQKESCEFCEVVRKMFGNEAAEIMLQICDEIDFNASIGVWNWSVVSGMKIDAFLEYVLGIIPEGKIIED